MSWLSKRSFRPFGTNGVWAFRVPWAEARGYNMSPLRGCQGSSRSGCCQGETVEGGPI